LSYFFVVSSLTIFLKKSLVKVWDVTL